MRFVVMVMARMPDFTIGSLATSRNLACSPSRWRHRPSDCHRQQPFLSLAVS